MIDVKEVWIAIQKKSQTKNQTLFAWYLHIAGANKTCNHLTSCL